jgi:large subunit ribosomal protein L13
MSAATGRLDLEVFGAAQRLRLWPSGERMRTYSAKTGEIDRQWFVVDASQFELGRLATRIATVLRGKHKPIFTPHVDTGDFVVVVNASQVRLSGNKLDQKNYHRYSGHPGGLRSHGAREVRENDPERMIQHAVKGMLPKNRLSRQVIKKLKVYGGETHPHSAQKPQPFPEVY